MPQVLKDLVVLEAAPTGVGTAKSFFDGALGEETVGETIPRCSWCSYGRAGRFGVKSSETDGSFPEISSSGQVALAT